jgi:anti-anti-sigma regulatory factor
MCRAERWSLARRGVAEALGVRRIGGSTFLLTPPTTLDAEASMLLVEAIAALAATQPRVVVDLTGVDVGDPSTAAVLLLRLEALAHGSGGQLRVVRAEADAGGIEIHRLERTDGDGADAIDRDLEHALESAARLAAG